jgi:VWFA-related protein
VGRAVAALFLAAVAGDARADAPLTAADVVRFLRAGISEQTIVIELSGRGFAEPLDPPREAALRGAGASETLIVAIRRAAPAPAPAVPPRPAAYAPPVLVTPEDGHEPTFSASTRTVRVPVSVLDPSGEPVMGLVERDFRISEDGKRQDVTLFSAERRPLRLALALDVSKSMQNKVRQVEEALKHFIDLLEPADQILVMTFNDHLRIAQDFTSDRQLLGRVLDSLEPEGGTALYDAALEAVRVGAGPAESKAVVLVTDGVDTASSVAFHDLREYARRAEVPVFSIGLDSGKHLEDVFRPRRRSGGGGGGWPGGGGGGRGGWPGGRGPGGGGWGGRGGGPGRLGFDDKPLKELADDTGGRAEIVKGLQHYTPDTETPGSDRLKQAVESIAMTLRHRYLLGYEPPEGRGGWREIRVEVDKPELTAHARKGYYAGG